jgi:hypothetical protein
MGHLFCDTLYDLKKLDGWLSDYDDEDFSNLPWTFTVRQALNLKTLYYVAGMLKQPFRIQETHFSKILTWLSQECQHTHFEDRILDQVSFGGFTTTWWCVICSGHMAPDWSCGPESPQTFIIQIQFNLNIEAEIWFWIIKVWGLSGPQLQSGAMWPEQITHHQVVVNPPKLTWSRILSSKCVCWHSCDSHVKIFEKCVSWIRKGCFSIPAT